jgi:hypothetical protein
MFRIGDRIGTYLVAIDASENVREQFTPSGIARELNKAYCGYQRVTLENTPSAPHADFPSFDNVATGIYLRAVVYLLLHKCGASRHV